MGGALILMRGGYFRDPEQGPGWRQKSSSQLCVTSLSGCPVRLACQVRLACKFKSDHSDRAGNYGLS
jgi:hypothetical protein